MTADLPATEGASARYADIETWSSAAILDALLDNQVAALEAVRPALPALATATEAAAARLRGGGRLAYAGAGTSGRIGVQDGAELPPTFDWPRDRLLLLMAGGDTALVQAVENAEDRADQGRLDGAGLGPADVLVGLAASGATPYTIGCIEAARAAGALTIGIANSPDAPLLLAAEHAILLQTGPEPIAGSTRMGAGTAQKAALNLFSTLLMTRLGRVYRGQMVDMLARNAKLRRRAVRMLCGLAAVDAAQAETALEAAGGRVKVALLVLRGMTAAEAEAALEAAKGDLRNVPSSPPPPGRGPG
jgi:N-acetylmuramic acid 6-phosphate etherase